MKIREIMQNDVITIGVNATIKDAAKLMKKRHVGTLVVAEKNRAAGIITDRDIALAFRKGSNYKADLMVSEVMTPNVIVCTQGEDPFSVMKKMKSNGIRRMPVLDHNDNIVGIISVDDFIRTMALELVSLSEVINAEIEKEGHTKLLNKEDQQIKVRSQLAS